MTSPRIWRIGLTGGIGSGKSTVSHMLVQLGAHLVDTDAISRALTAPGGHAIGPIAQTFGTDMIDACFLPAGGADGGRVETQVAGPAGDTVTMWQSSGAVYVYTGDRLARDSRASIAVEAISHVPDAFNDPTARSTVSLAPGASRTFRCGFDYHPAGS